MRYARCDACGKFKECEPASTFKFEESEPTSNFSSVHRVLCKKCSEEETARLFEGVEVTDHEITEEELEAAFRGLEKAAKDHVFRAAYKRRIRDPNSKEHGGYMGLLMELNNGNLKPNGRVVTLMRKCGLLERERSGRLVAIF
jgi:hypothetical protein